MPKLALNAKLKIVMALNAKTHEWVRKAALNAKAKEKNGDDCGCGYESTTPSITSRMTNGSKRLNANVAQNAETENDDGFDRRTGNGDGSKRRNG